MGSWKKGCLAVFAVLAVAFLAVGVYPFVREGVEVLDLTPEIRAAIDAGDFAELTDGVTHYHIAGPASGQPVVLIHGITSPSFIWDEQVDSLTGAGFRVLRLDLYGRGYSDRPRIHYTAEVFDRQVLELLDKLGIDRPVDLLGLSMGGAVAVHFMDRHPERVRRFALFAPAGFPLHVPMKYRIMKAPLLGDWIMAAIGDQTITAGLPNTVPGNLVRSAEFIEKYMDCMQYKGYKRALLSTLRHNPVLGLREVYRRVGQGPHRGILFWGTADHVVPFQHHELVEAAMPGIEFYAVEGADHLANYEQPEAVNPLLVEFLQQKGSGPEL